MLSSVPVSTPRSEDGHINDFGRLQQAEQRVKHLSNPEHEERQITNAKVNEEIAIVGHIASKVLSHDHMPNSALRGVQLTLDVFCDILLHRIQRHALDVNSLHQSTPSSLVLRSPSAGPPPSPRTCTPPSWLKCREQNTSPSQIPCFLGRTKKEEVAPFSGIHHLPMVLWTIYLLSESKRLSIEIGEEETVPRLKEAISVPFPISFQCRWCTEFLNICSVCISVIAPCRMKSAP